MLESHISEDDLLIYEPSLEDYRRLDELNFDGVILSAKHRLERIVSAKGLDLRKLCNRLILADGIKSGKDIINRNRLVINVTSGEGTLTFEGTNDSTDEVYTTILDNFPIIDTGEFTKQFGGNYSYYKLTKSGTLVYTAYLVEISFEEAHVLLALHMLFLRLIGIQGTDNFQERADWYWELFQNTMATLRYSVDKDLDGDIDSNDDVLSINTITMQR